MYTIRLIHLLLVTLGLMTAVHASYINVSPNHGPALQVRQDASGSGSQQSAPPSATGGGAEATPTPSADEKTTTAQSSTTQRESTTTTNQGEQTTPAPNESTTTTTQGGESTTQRNNQDTTTPPADQTTPEPSYLTSWVVFSSTAADGQVVPVSSEATFMVTPSLSANESDSNGGGMSPDTVKIVAGVIGGVGGAIVLAGLAFVAWRIWGRKKRLEENDGLMDYHTAGTSAFNNESKPDGTASSTAASRSPFQTTLEDYHRPTNVNASSNF